jgi:4-hydroxyproline epimerase
VPSYRTDKAVRVQVEGHREIAGDVAWGGNWFFLTDHAGLELKLSNVEALTDYSWRIRQGLARQGIRGRDGGEIDHVELFGPPAAGGDSRSFVLCPGKAYDRSPCGTGTSAKLACLAADGKLAPGQRWRQESILGSIFEGFIEREGDAIVPTISGSAFVNAEATLLVDAADPFRAGIRG